MYYINTQRLNKNRNIQLSIDLKVLRDFMYMITMGVGSGGEEAWPSLDFHTWYKYSR